jgi:hypothetical protein
MRGHSRHAVAHVGKHRQTQKHAKAPAAKKPVVHRAPKKKP